MYKYIIDIMDRFKSNGYIPLRDKDLGGKSIGEFLFSNLVVYDNFEEYDPEKKYETDEYEFEYYPNQRRRYINELLIYEYHNIKFQYVVAREVLSKEEKEILKRYCQCEKHRMSIFNVKRYFMGEWIIGCLNCDRPSQFVIWKTRQYVKNNMI